MVKALYFSAHWCPPCRGFTPKLTEFFNKANSVSRENFKEESEKAVKEAEILETAQKV